MFHRTLVLGVGISVALLIGCSSESDSGGGGGDTVSSLTTSLKLTTAFGTVSPVLSRASSTVSAAGSEQLESLKFYLLTIALCEELTISGTGFSNPTGCITVYSGTENSQLNHDTTPSEAWVTLGENARSITDGYIDLMSEADRARVAGSLTLTEGDARSYQWGYVTWHLPIKVKASFTLGAATHRTSDGVLSLATPGDMSYVQNLFSGNFSTVSATDAEEAIVVLGNGGNWFKFQRPLAITSEDITAGTSFAVDFAFNPENIIKAYDSSVSCSSTECNGLTDSVGNKILVPFLDLIPIARPSDQELVRTSYLGTATDGSNEFKIRLEFFTIEGSSTIYAVTATTIPTETTTAALPAFPKISYIEEREDGKIDLLLYDNSTKSVEGFEFGAESTSAQINCTEISDSVSGFMPSTCSDGVFGSVTFVKQ